MDGSDDYFTDDIIFDDAAIAALDEQEKVFISQQRTKAQETLPPTKKQKTSKGWKPGIGNQAEALEFLNGTPDISLTMGGVYTNLSGFRNLSNAFPDNTPPPVPPPLRANIVSRPISNQASRVIPRHVTPTPAVSAPASRQPSFTQRSQPAPQTLSQPQRQNSVNLAPRAPSRPPSRPVTRQPTVVANLAPNATHSKKAVDEKKQKDELEVMRLKFEELQSENAQTQAALKEALSRELMKEGEVSNLRRSIEKTARDHAEQVSKLRSAKDQSEADQAQTKKKMEEEMERLRTQFMFKQQELEASRLIAPFSARSNKIGKGPMTPAHGRGWGRSESMRSNATKGTNNQLQIPVPTSGSPRLQRIIKKEHFRNIPSLPGFENAFLASPSRKSKGKQRAVENETLSQAKIPAPSFLKYPSQLMNNDSPPASPPSSPTRHKPPTVKFEPPAVDAIPVGSDYGDVGDSSFMAGVDNYDVEMLDVHEQDSPVEDSDQFEPINWKNELSHILFSHTVPPSTDLSLLILLNVNFPESILDTHKTAYTSACARILEKIGVPSSLASHEEVFDTIALSLTHILRTLDLTNELVPLTTVLNLLSTLIHFLPNFSASVLSVSPAGGGPSSQLLVSITAIIKNRLVPSKDHDKTGYSPELLRVAEGVITCLEALCWNLTAKFEERVISAVCDIRALDIFLDRSQPTSFLARTTRLLMLVSAYPNNFRQLITSSDIDADPGTSRLSHIENISAHLIDHKHQGEEAESMRAHILTFVAMLSSASPEASAALLESPILVLSLIVFLYRRAALIWEDNESIPEKASASLRLVNQTVLLIHGLVFSVNPPLNLRQRFQYAPRTQFSGVHHMFIVAFGRLSYAEPPEWADQDTRRESEQLAEFARDLLDIVVEGPEADSVYSTFQNDDAAGGHETEDDEMEAKLLA